MKKHFLMMILVFTFILAVATPQRVQAQNQKIFSNDTKLNKNTVADDIIVKSGAILDLNGHGLEVGKSLTVKNGGKIIGDGLIIFQPDATCTGLKLYYMLENEYRPLPAGTTIHDIYKNTCCADEKPQLCYVKKLNAFCIGTEHGPKNMHGNPFNEDFNQKAAKGILKGFGKIKVTAKLSGICDAAISWLPLEDGKNYQVFYRVYYKNVTEGSNYVLAATIQDKYQNSYELTDLDPCSRYYFKVLPSIEYFGKEYHGTSYKVASIDTLGQIKAPSVTSSLNDSNYVVVCWDNIAGKQESAYEILVSKDAKGKETYKTVKTKGSSKSKEIKVEKGVKLYYRVRVYKYINGEKVYAEYSKATAFQLD